MTKSFAHPGVKATEACANPPAWAVAERDLLARLGTAVEPFLAKYLKADGTLIYRDNWVQGRDGLDDLYESFYNFPLAYLLGAPAHLLDKGHRQWEAMTVQGTAFGLVHNEYEVGYDQFHQSEGNLLFYFLCAADPDNAKLQERARRFAGFYMNAEPEAPNYDEEHNIIRAVHNGSKGPRWGYIDGDSMWSKGMAPYGLPFDDVPGITSYDDIAAWHNDPRRTENSKRLIASMNERMGKGDSVANLPVTSLVTNAFLMTRDPVFRQWVVRYVDGWWQRAEANDGVLPDNVGLGGAVGEYFDGRWYGAAYGWSWPHGYDSVIDAATVAAINTTMLTGDTGWLDLPGRHFDMLYAKGKRIEDFRTIESSISNAWVRNAAAVTGRYDTYVMPKRYKDSGWFDFQTIGLANLVQTWAVTQSPADRARMVQLEQDEPYDWTQSYPFHSKGDDSHDRPWLKFLEGNNPDYPEIALRHAAEQVEHRLEMVRTDVADLSTVHIHHWQNHNPVTTEALIQLTLGAPQALYNGGFIQSCFRHFDPDQGRPGLPEDVAALVYAVGEASAGLQLVNLSKTESRRVLVQGGFHGEHRITAVRVDGAGEATAIGGRYMVVDLPPASTIRLDVGLARLAAEPGYDLPDYAAYASRTNA